MKFETEVVLLSVQRQPYTMEGRSGVAYPARVIHGGNTYKLRATEELYEQLRDVPQLTKGKAVIEITSAKENNTVNLRSFVAVK